MYKKNSGYKRKLPTRKYQTQKKSMVLPYGKNVRYRPAPKRTKKAVQQINSIQYINAVGLADQVAVATATTFQTVSAIKQGTKVDECTGTSVYAKSLYFQAEITASPAFDTNANDDVFVGNVATNVPSQALRADVVKAKNVRVVVLLDRAPNGTRATISDVYKCEPAPPQAQNYTAAALGQGDASSLLMLDPDKTRRFKILMNEVVSVSLNSPVVHIEKYIPLNFYMTFTNNTADPTYANIITNGIYVAAFTSPSKGLQNPNYIRPLWAFSSKLRFEP